jgi:hypothetical protein
VAINSKISKIIKNMGIINKAKEKLRETISNSAINEKQKIMWFDFIEKSRIQELDLIFDALQEDPAVIGFLTKNLEDKINFLKSKSKANWEDIMKEEQQFMTKI